jgi:hypothetical protein
VPAVEGETSRGEEKGGPNTVVAALSYCEAANKREDLPPSHNFHPGHSRQPGRPFITGQTGWRSGGINPPSASSDLSAPLFRATVEPSHLRCSAIRLNH